MLCTLLADPHDKFTFIAPPNFSEIGNLQDALGVPRLSGQVIEGPTSSSVTVNVTYTNFTTAQRTAFQYAVDIWKSQLTSSIPIEITADMQSLGSGVLGQAGPYIYEVSGSWYPTALANKLLGANLSGPDIVVSLNSSFSNWYLGTDGNTPSGQYDFVTVVLHELGHGLGFSGSMHSNGSQGSWGISGVPEIYDRFTENGSGTRLLTFASPSTTLHAQLTGQAGGVLWNGTGAMAANGGGRPRLYAPSSFMAGSSYTHLDESTYSPSVFQQNALMTPALGSAEAIHDPGPVARGLLSDIGWTTSASCTYTLSSSSATAAATASSGTVSVTTSSGCSWSATSNSSALAISGTTSFSGSGTVSYLVSANAGRPRTGTLSIAGQTFTVSQSSTLPTLTAAPSTLSFVAVNSGGGTLTASTVAQPVALTQAGSGTVPWTATTSAPWLQASPARGTGTGLFNVSVVSSSVLPSTGTVTGTVTIGAPNAQADVTVTVSLRLSAPTTTAVPFGQVDTPAQNATGVQGAIGVTGWALDDVGIASIKIYRNCLSFEAQSNCVTVGGVRVVFVGDASFLTGARPDVETAFPTYPQANRAGWGYLMLTNMLPDVTNSRGRGGQGPLVLYAFATDVEGNRQLLGRAWHPTQPGVSDPTTFTMANASIAKPFGAIDTPSQGGVVSGTFPNFGWTLTSGTAMMPLDGSTIRVILDGVSVGTVTYNQCRAGSTNRPPAGTCQDDIATLFQGFTNITGGSGAIGSFDINTTTLSNGLHTIAWGVIDNQGRAEGIGSRFFTVLNGTSSIASVLAAPAQALGTVSGLLQQPLDTGEVYGRHGFDLDAPLETVPATVEGSRHVRLDDLGRLELSFQSPVDAGYLRVGDELRPLPPGSTLDAGRFAWVPGAGYFGAYQLVFVGVGGQLPIEVTIGPKPAATSGAIAGHIDLPQANAGVAGEFRVAGWALDWHSWQGAGIGAVHVWAQRRDVPTAAPEFLGAADVGLRRPDVASAFGTRVDRAGWNLPAASLPPGVYDVTAYFWSSRLRRFDDARTVRITVR